MLPSEIKEKSEIIISKLKLMFGDSEQLQILIAENIEPYSEARDYYIDPYSFIIDTGELIPNRKFLDDFRNFLRDTLKDIGIEVFSKHFLKKATEQNIDDELVDDYKHLLATAIDIRYLDSKKSWEEQFAEQLTIIKEQESLSEQGSKRLKAEDSIDSEVGRSFPSLSPTVHLADSPLRQQENCVAAMMRTFPSLSRKECEGIIQNINETQPDVGKKMLDDVKLRTPSVIPADSTVTSRDIK